MKIKYIFFKKNIIIYILQKNIIAVINYFFINVFLKKKNTSFLRYFLLYKSLKKLKPIFKKNDLK
jgi:hypothetical protein